MNTSSMNEKISYFNQRGPNWDEIVGNNTERLSQIRDVFTMINIQKGHKVLDAGCGNGVLFKFIEEKTGSSGEIVAIDAAEAMISRAKKIHDAYDNIRYIVGMLESVYIDENYFNAILCFSIIPHVDDKTAAFMNMRNSLRSDGRLYIFHLSDTKTLNDFHSTIDGPVRHDVLPCKDELEFMLNTAGLYIATYIDRKGLNFIECTK